MQDQNLFDNASKGKPSIFLKTGGDTEIDNAVAEGALRFGALLASGGGGRPVDASFGTKDNPISSNALKDKPARRAHPNASVMPPEKESQWLYNLDLSHPLGLAYRMIND